MAIDGAAVWDNLAITPTGTAASSQQVFTPALIIALSALAFTILSFWWINVRAGRLAWTTVVVFSGYVHTDKASLRIPVTLYNSGAKPLVVVDLRLEMVSGAAVGVAASKQYRRSFNAKARRHGRFSAPVRRTRQIGRDEIRCIRC